MRFWVFVLIAVVFAWFITRPRRRSKRLLRKLTAQYGGSLRPGTWFSPPVFATTIGDTTFQLQLARHPGSRGKLKAVLHAPWSADRQIITPSPPESIQLATPTPAPLAGRPSAGQGGAVVPNKSPAMWDNTSFQQSGTNPVTNSPVSTSLLHTGLHLQRQPGTHDTQIFTQLSPHMHSSRSGRMGPGHTLWVCTTVLVQRQPELLAQWLHRATQYHRILMAETELGIAFQDTPPVAPQEQVACPICGVPAAPSEQVFCAACGAPHHAECWSYNGGCAIYGCRCTQPRGRAS